MLIFTSCTYKPRRNQSYICGKEKSEKENNRKFFFLKRLRWTAEFSYLRKKIKDIHTETF